MVAQWAVSTAVRTAASMAEHWAALTADWKAVRKDFHWAVRWAEPWDSSAETMAAQ